ncbi:GTPase RhebL1 isoform X4 [Macaca nemestrina]|uniref:RHEB like 1 n=2 Tax=Macaca TaxID=9539 RepID=A0A7N9CBH0_MACFA|nr:GTPase RhebL1 isoform X4 [Macaca nemestrina]XP_015286358.1 GTPase RhebL1 isoform X2 [Macaca fascicularis]
MPLVRYRKVVILGYRSVVRKDRGCECGWMIWIQLPHCSPQGRHLWHINLWKASSRKATILQWRIDEYSILPYSFIIGVHGYVLVYSVTSLHSFQVIESLYQKLHEGHGKTRVPVVLVGNKADLSPEREVQAVEGKKLAESWGATFMESSARENQLTQGIFTKVIQEIARVENSYGQERRCHLM